MKRTHRRNCLISFFLFSFLLGLAATAWAQKPEPTEADVKRMKFIATALESVPKAKPNEDKTLSPYFFVFSEDPNTDRLPLKSTRADVNIAGVIAEVNVTQVYKNEGKNVLEAIYLFPASTRAAIYAMKMTVGKRVIEAQIKKRKEAREEYERARQEGRTASLLEQQRPNVFQMNVANILPGDEIKVEMAYTELLVPEENLYRFVYPTVVGPRYSNVKADGASDTEKWVENPYLHEGKKAPFTFGLDVNLQGGLPIDRLHSPSHKIGVEYTGKNQAHIGIKPGNDTGNRDFVLEYALAGNQIESGLLLYEGKKENFFLLMMEPPKRVTSKKIVPREYIFIIDVSGSMNGFPLKITKELMKKLFRDLTKNDFFNVLLFAGDNDVLAETSLPASRANIKKAIEVVDQQRGGGGTELLPALKRALALPHQEGTSRIIVAVTDGYISVEKDAFEIINTNLGKANFFAFGVGSSVNRYLIEGMARAGMGEPLVILSPEGADKKAKKFREYISSPVLQGIQVDFENFKAYDVEPPAVPDLFATRPVVAFGKYKGKAQGQVVVKGHVPNQKFEKKLEVEKGTLSESNAALRYLWARHRILRLADMNKLQKTDDRIKEVTKLGLDYNLMTEFTSFVAVDTKVRADGKKVVTVKQPLPMPAGVSDLAVGGGRSKSKGMMMHRMAPVAPTAELADLSSHNGPPTTPPKKIRGFVKLDTAKTKIQGQLDAQTVQKAVEKYLSRLTSTYERELRKNASLAGTVEVELTVDRQGHVRIVRIQSSTLKNKTVEKRTGRVLRKARFGKTGDENGAVIVLTLNFSPKA